MMKVIKSLPEMTAESRQIHRQNLRLGLVPTMGFLHEGHLSLIRLARKQSDRVVVSIFVNPVQFAPGEDFEQYPRDFDNDQALCRREGVDLIFYPAATGMYTAQHQTLILNESLSRKLCGASRPTHFQGVTTVVAKLFNIVQPDLAVFGQKDAQQCLIIRRMVEDLNIPVTIAVAPIVREADGLAMSSRNSYLSPGQRSAATILYRSLHLAEELVKNGEIRAAKIRQAMMEMIQAVAEIRIDYLAIVDYSLLEPVTEIMPGTLIAVAAYVGTTRLIDNITLD
jgi:pantoate--beta-alanine ligase